MEGECRDGPLLEGEGIGCVAMFPVHHVCVGAEAGKSGVDGVGDIPRFGFPGTTDVYLWLVFLFGFVQANREEDLSGEVLLEAVKGGGRVLVWLARAGDEF